MNDTKFHYVPHCDERPHDLKETCWCRPLLQWHDFETNEPLAAPLIVHNAADCREIVEEATGDGCGGWDLWQVDPIGGSSEVIEGNDVKPRFKKGDTPSPGSTPGPQTAGESHPEPAGQTEDDDTWHDSCDDPIPDNWEDEGEDWKKAA